MRIIKYIFIIVCFLLGIYFICTFKQLNNREGFAHNKCPNILFQEGSKIVLYNSRVAKIPGVNPIKFDNLEEYKEFLEWQRSQNIRCPVLHFQKSIDAQGNDVYAIKPSPTSLDDDMSKYIPPKQGNNVEKSKLYDAGRDDPPYNKNSYPGFDSNNQYIGLDVPLDDIKPIPST
jgi:hypothetical protein